MYLFYVSYFCVFNMSIFLSCKTNLCSWSELTGCFPTSHNIHVFKLICINKKYVTSCSAWHYFVFSFLNIWRISQYLWISPLLQWIIFISLLYIRHPIEEKKKTMFILFYFSFGYLDTLGAFPLYTTWVLVLTMSLPLWPQWWLLPAG